MKAERSTSPKMIVLIISTVRLVDWSSSTMKSPKPMVANVVKAKYKPSPEDHPSDDNKT